MARDMQHIAGSKTRALLKVLAGRCQGQPKRVLVVGCGSGHEAAILADTLKGETYGVDLGGAFDQNCARRAVLLRMDAERLAFAESSFDLVYCFHALEHFSSPHAALAEMNRVLTPDGIYCIGTPNRARILGYIGSPVSFSVKLRWNLQDLWMRLMGRWSNEQGAHAGFYDFELKRLCTEYFATAEEATSEYYREVYGVRFPAVVYLMHTPIARFILPCVYFVGEKATPFRPPAPCPKSSIK
jgi:ubiquinone/menaquinone biosynthesis C-methylase UbiE